MTGPPPLPGPLARVAPGRLLAAAVAALVLAAIALWGASRGTWLTATWDVPLRGRVVSTATGAEAEPILVPWALLSLAAVAGVLATSGWGRRVVGVVVAVAGLWALLRAVSGLAAPAPDALPPVVREGGRAVAVAVDPAWPLLAALGAVLLAGGGLLVAVAAPVLPRLGARYDAPGSSRRPPDPDRELWEALDAGEDPTDRPAVGGHPPATDDTSGRSGPVPPPEDGSGEPDGTTAGRPDGADRP